MKMNMIAAAIAAVTMPALAGAQEVPAQAMQDKVAVEQRVATGGRLMATVETRITPGRPYSAEAVTELLHGTGRRQPDLEAVDHAGVPRYRRAHPAGADRPGG